jgi:hypothetical protein
MGVNFVVGASAPLIAFLTSLIRPGATEARQLIERPVMVGIGFCRATVRQDRNGIFMHVSIVRRKEHTDVCGDARPE